MNDEHFTKWTLLVAFLYGAVGGVAPSLLELAAKLRADQIPSGGYYLAMGIFAFLGGFVATVYKEQLTHKAFLLGVGAPALIVAGGSLADTRPTLNLSGDLLALASVTEQSALYRTSFPIVSVRPTTMKGIVIVVPFKPEEFGSGFLEKSLKLKAITPGSAELIPLEDASTTPIYPDLPREVTDANTKIAILPNDVKSISLEGFVISYDDRGARQTWAVRTEPIEIPPDGKFLRLSFRKEELFWAGFFEAIGMRRRSREYVTYPATIQPEMIPAQ